MRALRLHVEDSEVPGNLCETGHLQQARARSLPLLSGCSNGNHGLARQVESSALMTLEATHVQKVPEIEFRVRKALSCLSTLAPLAKLASPVIRRAKNRVIIEGEWQADLCRRLLQSIKSLDSSILSVESRVSLLSCRPDAAIQRFNDGELDATAPSCFEIYQKSIGHKSLRHVDTDIYACLLIRPGLKSAQIAFESAFRQKLLRAADWPGICIASLMDDVSDSQTASVSPEPLVLEYADYWPNASIAKSIQSAFAHWGVPVHLRTNSLAELRSKTLSTEYDIALVLLIGYLGPHLSIPIALTIAASSQGAFLSEKLTDALAEGFRSKETDAIWNRVANLAARQSSLVPLGRFRSGYLASDAVLAAPLAFGCVIASEHGVGGCHSS